MVSDKIGLQLHDKFTRGLVLSAAEKQTLEAWYAQKDATERNGVTRASAESLTDSALQQVIAEAHKRLVYLTERLQTIEEENEQIGLENKRLREKLETALLRQTA